jgi:hypothetical protein
MAFKKKEKKIGGSESEREEFTTKRLMLSARTHLLSSGFYAMDPLKHHPALAFHDKARVAVGQDF